MIKIQGVTKVFDPDILALSNVSFGVEKGDFVFFIGPTGSGKTTLLRMFIREVLPTRGQIFVGGENLALMPRKMIPYFRRDIGVVFQDYKLLPNKTAYENVAFVLESVGMPMKEVRNRVMQALDLVGISHRRRLFPEQLSGGEQQRIALARAIVNSPALLLADEPTGNLDPETADDIMNLLLSINARGTTLVISTHNKEIVDRLKKRVIALKQGILVRDQRESGYFDYGSH